jgi:hypothetical protein
VDSCLRQTFGDDGRLPELDSITEMDNGMVEAVTRQQALAARCSPNLPSIHPNEQVFRDLGLGKKVFFQHFLPSLRIDLFLKELFIIAKILLFSEEYLKLLRIRHVLHIFFLTGN